MDTLSYKTKSAKKSEVDRKWWIIDGDGVIVGRKATAIATVLRGKHKPSFTPHVDCGDNVIVINAGKMRFTGNKRANKVYLTYSGYPGGQKSRTADHVVLDCIEDRLLLCLVLLNLLPFVIPLEIDHNRNHLVDYLL